MERGEKTKERERQMGWHWQRKGMQILGAWVEMLGGGKEENLGKCSFKVRKGRSYTGEGERRGQGAEVESIRTWGKKEVKGKND